MPTRTRRAASIAPPTIQVRDVIELFPYDNNPRDNEEAVQSVANSIRDFGFLVPIIVDGNSVIVAGHTRYEAAKLLGIHEVPVIVAEHLTPQQIAAFRLVDNKVSELARWDFDALAGELSALRGSGIDFTQLGWSQNEIDCLTDTVAEDCMSAGSVTDMENDEHRRRAAQRAPGTARFVCAEFIFFIPQAVMRRWASALRVEGDYDETEITRILKDRMGITPYEDQ